MFKSGWNVFDFSYNDCKKIFNQEVWFFFWVGGTPILAPQSVVSPKMSTPAQPMIPLFYCRILFCPKNGNVCNKLELNILKINWAIAILNLRWWSPFLTSKNWNWCKWHRKCLNIGTIPSFKVHNIQTVHIQNAQCRDCPCLKYTM